jgi:hypothetical protein
MKYAQVQVLEGALIFVVEAVWTYPTWSLIDLLIFWLELSKARETLPLSRSWDDPRTFKKNLIEIHTLNGHKENPTVYRFAQTQE